MSCKTLIHLLKLFTNKKIKKKNIQIKTLPLNVEFKQYFMCV